jgi:hypothetical protein
MLNQDDIREWWDRLSTEITTVLDEEGRNIEHGQLRATEAPGIYLYVDDVDGFDLLNEHDAQMLGQQS